MSILQKLFEFDSKRMTFDIGECVVNRLDEGDQLSHLESLGFTIPAKWEVCGSCGGSGTTTRHENDRLTNHSATDTKRVFPTP